MDNNETLYDELFMDYGDAFEILGNIDNQLTGVDYHALNVAWAVIFVLGFGGNLVVIFTLLCEADIRKKSSVCFTLNLAIANFVMVCFCPLAIYKRAMFGWIFGRFVCRIISGVDLKLTSSPKALWIGLIDLNPPSLQLVQLCHVHQHVRPNQLSWVNG